MSETVQNYQNVIETVKAFNEGLRYEDGLAAKLSYFRAWYYVPELDVVGPSKFIGYKGMTAAKYAGSADLDGRETEPVLAQWFHALEPSSAEAEFVRGKVKELLTAYHKPLNDLARFSAPRSWSFRGQRKSDVDNNLLTQSPRDVSPIVEVFWRAYTSLYPEDQAALAGRIGRHKRETLDT